ncbi:MAG: helix-turn-helix transcriptional regulator [Chloroflexi bacterium]|nr:helix-turn-helix transcriptional regulator [Chloroflexota bacterium]
MTLSTPNRQRKPQKSVVARFHAPGSPQSILVGWRVKQLRLRRKLTQTDVARLSGLDVAYVSRIESGAVRFQPKPGTVARILDALNATHIERDAVFHTEAPPLSRADVAKRVEQVAAHQENSPIPATLLDERWFRWYQNRASRAVLGLTSDAYTGHLGEHVLEGLIRPSSPVYPRLTDDARRAFFASLAYAFKITFANQQFDCWYLDLVSRLTRDPAIQDLWENPPDACSLFLDRHDVTVVNAQVGVLRFHGQLNRLRRDSRFILLQWHPADTATTKRLARLNASPEFSDTAQVSTIAS